jgi:hypothetical protein
VELTAFVSAIMGVGLRLFLSLVFVFSICKILMVGIMLFDSVVFVVVVSFFLVEDLVDEGGVGL